MILGISAPPDIQYEPYNPANEFVTAAGPSGSSGSSSGPSAPLPVVSGQSSFQAPIPSSRRDGAAPAPAPPSHHNQGGQGHIIETSVPVAKENEVRKVCLIFMFLVY